MTCSALVLTIIILIPLIRSQALSCPSLTFSASAPGAVLAQGCQTPTDASGSKNVTCSDGPTSTDTLLTFTYDDGSGVGAQTGSLLEIDGDPVTMHLQCQNGQWIITDFEGTYVLTSTTIFCETSCTNCPAYDPCTCPNPNPPCGDATPTSSGSTTTPSVVQTPAPTPAPGSVTTSTTSGSLTTVDPSCCPVGGVWGEWTEMDKCTDKCGACGTVRRTRTCLSLSTGCPCSGYSAQVVPCNTQPCSYPRDSCCNGRLAMSNGNGRIICGPEPVLFDPKPLVTGCMPVGCCPVQGVWSHWSSWTTCNDTCGGCGLQMRRRVCLTEANGCSCSGSKTMTRPCAFTPCSGSRAACCGGLSTIQGSCGPKPAEVADPPPGALTCSPGSCPPAGVWSAWSQTTCSDSCGMCGTGTYSRTCVSAPGCPCTGPTTKTDACGLSICPFPRKTCCDGFNLTASDGQFYCSSLSAPSPVSTTTQPPVVNAALAAAPGQNCTWTSWTPFQCNATCGMCGVFVRRRSCPAGCCSGSNIDVSDKRCGNQICAFPNHTCCVGASRTASNHKFVCTLDSSTTGRKKRYSVIESLLNLF